MPVRLELSQAHPHVAVVVIDRPERANCLDPAMLVELAAAWRRIAEDDDIRCAVVRGAGERVFCSGMDMAATIPAARSLDALSMDLVRMVSIVSSETPSMPSMVASRQR